MSSASDPWWRPWSCRVATRIAVRAWQSCGNRRWRRRALCHAGLPPGLDGLYELATRTVMRIQGMVTRGEVSWSSLPLADRKEMDDAVAMLTEAAAQGHMTAQAYLAEIYEQTLGVAQDHGRSFELYMQAARQGHIYCQTNVGVMYRDGEGCEQSYERAAEWWAKAAEQGHADAQFNLGLAYNTGQGVTQSYERAVELYKLPAAQGHPGALCNLGKCYFYSEGVDNSYAEARRLFELAVAGGEATHAPRNLQRLNSIIQQDCPLLAQRVVLRGLDTEALNGTCGTAIDFSCSVRDPVTGNGYTAGPSLDGPEERLVKVRVANVEEEEDDWTGGAGGGDGGEGRGGGRKKKGGGKMGRRRK